MCTPQKPPDLLVRGGQPSTSVDEEENDIRLLHRELCLTAHGAEDMVALVKLDAARIYYRKLVVQPLRIHIDAVTRHPRHVIDNRHALLTNLIEQR